MLPSYGNPADEVEQEQDDPVGFDYLLRFKKDDEDSEDEEGGHAA